MNWLRTVTQNYLFNNFVCPASLFSGITVLWVKICIFTFLFFSESSRRFRSFVCCSSFGIFRVALLFICQGSMQHFVLRQIRFAYLYLFVASLLFQQQLWYLIMSASLCQQLFWSFLNFIFARNFDVPQRNFILTHLSFVCQPLFKSFSSLFQLIIFNIKCLHEISNITFYQVLQT